jgi:hypothetical protein
MVLIVLSLLRLLVAALVDFMSARAQLAAKNLLLRQQLVILQRTARRPHFQFWERRLLPSFAVRWSHRGLRLQPPAGEKWLPRAQPPPSLSVQGTPFLGGLHNRYGTIVDRAPRTG